MNIPCNECLKFPICKYKYELRCEDITTYLYPFIEPEMGNVEKYFNKKLSFISKKGIVVFQMKI
jgi:hypothetical protein